MLTARGVAISLINYTNDKSVNNSNTNTGGRGKSQYPYVGLNSSVTECPIEIILSGMTYYHQGICQIEKYSCSFFFLQMKVYFPIYLIVWIVFGHSNYVCPEKNESYSFLDDRDTKHNEFIHHV